VSWSTLRWRRIERIVRAEPTLVARGGKVLDAARLERLLPSDLEGAARAAGLTSVAETDAVILETDGSLTVVPVRGTIGGHPTDERVSDLRLHDPAVPAKLPRC
jgi:uncharacterized membrane protein YcaP (DUF421 family)